MKTAAFGRHHLRRRLMFCVVSSLWLPALATAAAPSPSAETSGEAASASSAPRPPVSGSQQVKALRAVQVQGYSRHGYTLPSSTSATGMDLSLRQTPQSIAVMTRQQLEDENVQNMTDVMAAAPGVSSYSQDNAGRTTYRARGFNITNYRIDGMLVDATASMSGGAAAINMDLYDNVQIVMGANGLMGGTGDPSATIYLARKLPQRQFGLQGSVTTGSWDKKRGMLDLNLPLTKDGRIRSRLVVSDENSGSFRERESSRRLGVLGSVAADLSDSTTLTLGVQYERTRNNGASWGSNVPIWYADGSRTQLSRRTNPAANWSLAERNATTWFGSLVQQLPGDWHASLSFSQSHADAYNDLAAAKVNNAAKKQGGYAGFWSQDGSGAYLNALHAEYADSRTNIDLNASGPLHLFGRSHQLIFGFSGYRDQETTYTFNAANCNIAGVAPYSACQYRATGLPIADWQTWDGSYAGFQTYRTDARSLDTTLNYGFYGAGHFNLADHLNLILGGRISNYRTQTTTYSSANVGTRSPASGDTQVWTPYAGLLYDLDQHHTVYASYTSIFSPQGDVRDANNQRLAPVTGDSYEAGIKGEYFHGRLNASLAWFKNKQNNVAESTGLTNLQTGASIYQAVSGVRSQGADLEFSGRIGHNWAISGGYTYVQTQGLSYRQDPRNLFKLFTTYTLPGVLHHLTVGGGVTVQGSTQWAVNPGRPLGNGRYDASNITLGGYTLLNLMARYELSQRLQLILNVANATSKVYYTQFGFYDGLIYGTPRQVNLSLRFRL